LNQVATLDFREIDEDTEFWSVRARTHGDAAVLSGTCWIYLAGKCLNSNDVVVRFRLFLMISLRKLSTTDAHLVLLNPQATKPRYASSSLQDVEKVIFWVLQMKAIALILVKTVLSQLKTISP
jgi:hypothetical protein